MRAIGVVPPANSGSKGTVISTAGVETERKKKKYYAHRSISWIM